MSERLKPNTNVTGHFLDSSRLAEIAKWREVITGVTTNPVILLKDGVTDVPGHIGKICQIVGGGFPVSVEVPYSQMSEDEMVELGKAYAQMFPGNAVVKVPVVPGEKGLNVIKRLRGVDIAVNATLGITFAQLALAADAGANFISLFWGRALESREKFQEGPGPEVILESTLAYLVTRGHKDVRIIVGSVRLAEQARQAFALGAHVVTVSPEVLQQSMQAKRLDETIEQFDKAYQEASADPDFRLI